MTDGVYNLFGEKEIHLKPHRKPRGKGKNLSKEKSHENDLITEVRGLVERLFGKLTKKFGMFATGACWKHGDELFNFEFKICMF